VNNSKGEKVNIELDGHTYYKHGSGYLCTRNTCAGSLKIKEGRIAIGNQHKEDCKKKALTAMKAKAKVDAKYKAKANESEIGNDE
jgi:hypothetical protein